MFKKGKHNIFTSETMVAGTCTDRSRLVSCQSTVRQDNVIRKRHFRDTFLKAESKIILLLVTEM